MADEKHLFRRLHDKFIALFHREAGVEAPALAQQASADRWTERGIYDAVHRLHLAEHETQEVAGYAFAYSVGAHEALLLARAILSDPIVKGREAEALLMIEEGLSHGEILSALRARKTASDHDSDAVVVPFPSMGTRRT